MYRLKLLLLLWFVLFGFLKTEALITRTYAFKITINDIKTMRIITPGLANGQISLMLYSSEAGANVQTSSNSSDNHSWLQFTSISPIGVTRKIQVSVTNGYVPSGTILTLAALPCTTGEGLRGTTTTGAAGANPIQLIRNDTRTLITGIGSCYTGSSTTSGYNMIYVFKPDPNNLGRITSFTNNVITVTYTISNE